MERASETLLAPAVDWMRRAAGRRVVVVHHDDGDGLSSGAQLVRWLARAGEVPHLGTLHAARVTRRRRAEILALAPEAVVTADFAGDLDHLAHRLVEGGVKDVLLLDHHVPRVGALPDGALHVNPRLEDRSMPCAALVHDLLAALDPGWTAEAGWLATIGVLTDVGARDRPDLVRFVSERYPDLLPAESLLDLGDTRGLLATPFGRVARAVNAAAIVDGEEGMNRAVALLVAAAGPESLLAADSDEARAMFVSLDRLESEVERGRKVFLEERARVGVLEVQHVSAPFAIASSVSNQVSMDHPDSVVAVVELRSGNAHVSLRCQSGRVDLEAGVRAAVATLGAGRGGGHRVAAGATVPASRKKAFLKTLAAALESTD